MLAFKNVLYCETEGVCFRLRRSGAGTEEHHFIFRDLKNFGESDVLQINIVYKENSRRRSAVVYVLSFTEVFYFSCKILTIYPFAP